MQLKPAVDHNDHIQGNANAGLEIVEFGDYQCPHCGAAHPVLKEMMKELGSQIKFVFRNFPLSEMHPMARPAALAAEAAALQGKFWEMHDAIFEHQLHLNEQLLLKLAEKLTVNAGQFTNDIQSEALAAKVDNDFESGMRSGVNGTPTFFINGKKFNGGAVDLFDLLRSNAETVG
jgi:protein-disulfide isomerase